MWTGEWCDKVTENIDDFSWFYDEGTYKESAFHEAVEDPFEDFIDDVIENLAAAENHAGTAGGAGA